MAGSVRAWGMWREEVAKGCCTCSRGAGLGYVVWIVLYKQSLGNEREAAVRTAKKAKCGWLVKTGRGGGKTQRLKREVTDMRGEAWTGADCRWLALVTVGNEMWYF